MSKLQEYGVYDGQQASAAGAGIAGAASIEERIVKLPTAALPPGNGLKLDRTDLQILIELQKNGRITNFELSSRVGISQSPCHKRMRRLEKEGLIKGYRAEIDWARLSATMTIYALVSLCKHGLGAFQLFERYVRRHAEITACFALSGTHSYLLRFDCAGLPEFVAASRELLSQVTGIERLDSHIVLSQIKDEPVRLLPKQAEVLRLR